MICECGEPYVMVAGERYSRHLGGRNHWGAMKKLGKVQPRQPKELEFGSDVTEAEAQKLRALIAKHD